MAQSADGMVRFARLQQVTARIVRKRQQIRHDLRGKGAPCLFEVSGNDAAQVGFEALAQCVVVVGLPGADEGQPLIPRLEHSCKVANIERRIVVEM